MKIQVSSDEAAKFGKDILKMILPPSEPCVKILRGPIPSLSSRGGCGEAIVTPTILLLNIEDNFIYFNTTVYYKKSHFRVF